jgi:hypothetical protein
MTTEVDLTTKIEITPLAENITYDKQRSSLYLKKREGDIREIYLPDFDTICERYRLLEELHGLDWMTPQMFHNVMSFLKFWKIINKQNAEANPAHGRSCQVCQQTLPRRKQRYCSAQCLDQGRKANNRVRRARRKQQQQASKNHETDYRDQAGDGDCAHRMDASDLPERP